MTLGKWIAPDYLPGKILVFGRLLVDSLILLVRYPLRQSAKLARLIWKIKPRYTMVTNWNLVSLYQAVKEINAAAIPGDIVECGVWNGGSAAMMAVAHFEGAPTIPRTFWLFDSFSGLPQPGVADGTAAKLLYFRGLNSGSQQNVRAILGKLNLPLDHFHIVPGWFEDTLKGAPIERIALLHVDADWYDSVREVLEAFYDKVVPGGIIAFDDYGYWQGCRKAVDELLIERNIPPSAVRRVTKTGVHIRKPK